VTNVTNEAVPWPQVTAYAYSFLHAGAGKPASRNSGLSTVVPQLRLARGKKPDYFVIVDDDTAFSRRSSRI
jgi:hypothetical protein